MMCDEVIFRGRYLHTIEDLQSALGGGEIVPNRQRSYTDDDLLPHCCLCPVDLEHTAAKNGLRLWPSSKSEGVWILSDEDGHPAQGDTSGSRCEEKSRMSCVDEAVALLRREAGWQPKRRPYNASGSLSEYGVFPECDAPQPAGDGCHCATCTCEPNMTPAVRFDLSPAQMEGAIRDHLIRLGWTPPDERALSQQPEAQAQSGGTVAAWRVPVVQSPFGEWLDHGVRDGLVLVMHRGTHGWKAAGQGHALLAHQIYVKSVEPLCATSHEVAVVGLSGGGWRTVWARSDDDVTHPAPPSAPVGAEDMQRRHAIAALAAEVEALRAKVDALKAENARLREAFFNANHR